MRYALTIQLLASRWADAGILLPAFPLLASGRPLGIAEIAAASGVSAIRVTEALDSGRCERDATGRLIDLYGMTLTPTLHRLEIDRKIVFSCCALWAHVIPKLVERTVRVESVDPVSRELIRLSVSPQGVESVEPAQAVATMAIASQEAIEADVSAAFCSNVRHFVSRESADLFAAGSPARHVVDVPELDDSASQLHREIWNASSPAGGSD